MSETVGNFSATCGTSHTARDALRILRITRQAVMPLSQNEELARAIGAAAHPLRLDLLEAFANGLARRPEEVALVLSESLPNVRFHLRALQRSGFLAPTAPAAGQ